MLPYAFCTTHLVFQFSYFFSSYLNGLVFHFSLVLHFVCRVFDRNGDGFISKNEFKRCMMHFGEKFTDDEVEEMIAEADINNDGRIDYTEFQFSISQL